MSRLILDLNEFQRVADLSKYNHNFYKNTSSNHGYPMVEVITHEDYQYEEVWIIDDDKRMFLGCSYISLNDVLDIHFGVMLT